ncbi:MAG: metal-dependent hydrolase [Candidatus Woesearchaeota archaeon]|jgi:hypothetical protein|nr:metal-dependent hydrolase [Candidatus Woesearchaeota archaeon]|tara:strand:+ start:1166 stop:1645 length:480 start_codon:yes stop_codon:yes gene_type:complete
MPDWLSHILIGLILSEALGIKKKSLVVLGSLLPDFIVKFYLFSYFIHIPPYILNFTSTFHTIFMGFIITAFIAPLFVYDIKKTYLYLNLGYATHIIFDSMTRHFIGGEMLLFPFTDKMFSFGVFWANEYYYVLIPAIIIYLGIMLFKKINSGKRMPASN